jgi:polysaccharide export outer membrane protein
MRSGALSRGRLAGRLEAFCLAGVAALGAAIALGAQQPYVVGPQDSLSVAVWQEPDLSGTFSVEADGSFTYPMIGRVEAGGRTIEEIEAELRRRLAAGVLKSPQISVTVETYRSQRIFLMGEVRQPGMYPLQGTMSLIEALARAGSTTEMAGNEVLIVHRGTRSELETAPPSEAEAASDVSRIDLDRLQRGELGGDVVLRDGDRVFVPRAETVFVSGNVRNPGAYPIQKTTTVLQAVTLAGGVTDRGSAGRVKVIRMVDGERAEIRVSEDDLVLPGDTLVVLQRLF